MWNTVWEWLKGLFGGKGSVQIGRGNQSMTGSSTGANSPVVSAGRDVNLTVHGDSSKAPKTPKEEIWEWIQKSSLGEPVSHLLQHVIRLAQILSESDLERWARLELFGYDVEGQMKETDSVPEYRTVVGQYVDAKDDPVVFPGRLHFVNEYRFRQGVATLEDFAGQNDMQNIADPGFLELLKREFNVRASRFCFNPLAIRKVLHSIRNRAMDKVRELEIKATA